MMNINSFYNERLCFDNEEDYKIAALKSTKQAFPLGNRRISNKCYKLLWRANFFPTCLFMGVLSVKEKLGSNIFGPCFVLFASDFPVSPRIREITDICKLKSIPYVFIPTYSLISDALCGEEEVEVILINYDQDPGMQKEFQDAFLIVRSLWLGTGRVKFSLPVSDVPEVGAGGDAPSLEIDWPSLSSKWPPLNKTWPPLNAIEQSSNRMGCSFGSTDKSFFNEWLYFNKTGNLINKSAYSTQELPHYNEKLPLNLDKLSLGTSIYATNDPTVIKTPPIKIEPSISTKKHLPPIGHLIHKEDGSQTKKAHKNNDKDKKEPFINDIMSPLNTDWPPLKKTGPPLGSEWSSVVTPKTPIKSAWSIKNKDDTEVTDVTQVKNEKSNSFKRADLPLSMTWPPLANKTGTSLKRNRLPKVKTPPRFKKMKRSHNIQQNLKPTETTGRSFNLQPNKQRPKKNKDSHRCNTYHINIIEHKLNTLHLSHTKETPKINKTNPPTQTKKKNRTNREDMNRGDGYFWSTIPTDQFSTPIKPKIDKIEPKSLIGDTTPIFLENSIKLEPRLEQVQEFNYPLYQLFPPPSSSGYGSFDLIKVLNSFKKTE